MDRAKDAVCLPAYEGKQIGSSDLKTSEPAPRWSCPRCTIEVLHY
jgi:hypothetical protein